VRYHHVDVFTDQPFSGNSLTVFPDSAGLTASQMGRITAEMRHFESIFLEPTADAGIYRARIFDLIEEMDFAGHPLIGAAAVLHLLRAEKRATDRDGPAADGHARWTFRTNARDVEVRTEWHGPGRYAAVLDQGPATFLRTPEESRRADFASWFGLEPGHLDPDLPPQVVSTGLRYLILPVRDGALSWARIAPPGLDEGLAGIGAAYAYLLDADALEGRHWSNDGGVEDIATGSAAGCVAAYLRRHQRIGDGEAVTLHQGRYAGRSGAMTIRAEGAGEDIRSVKVGGDVALVARGTLSVLPEGDAR